MNTLHTDGVPARPWRFGTRLMALADRLLGIDARSLALFRIGLGLVLLAELAERARHLTAFYTDQGLTPRSLLVSGMQSPWSFSLHLASGAFFFQALLFLVALVAALALLLGYQTRLATFASWLLLISLFVRNPDLQSSGDILLSLLLFWGLFLPLGLEWSVDRARAANRAELPGRVLSVASAALLLQAAMVYVFTWWLKSGDPWRDGSAVWHALNWDQGTTALGRAMLQFPELLQLATHGVMAFEIVGPLLLFVPFYTPRIRLVIVPLFWLMHLSFALMMTLFTFPFVSIVSLVPFLPARFWGLLSKLSRWAPLGRLGATLRGSAASPLHFGLPPKPLQWRVPLAAQALAGVLLLYAIVWNLAGVLNFAAPFQGVARFLQIHQHWAMFAPYPRLDDGWFVIPGQLASGEEVDLFRAVISGAGEEMSWEKPASVAATFPNVQWRKYLENLQASGDHGRFHHFATYLYRTWNAGRPPERHLVSLDIFYMLEHTERLAYPPQPVHLWNHRFTE
jgi:hypothetical protein